MDKPKILTKEQRILKEDKRLRSLYKDLPKDSMKLYDGVIRRAAYMRITLEDYEADLDTFGYVEQFSQSEKTEPYDRERPVARLYNTMNKNFQCIMKQLGDALPEPAAYDAGSDLMKFALGVKK